MPNGIMKVIKDGLGNSSVDELCERFEGMGEPVKGNGDGLDLDRVRVSALAILSERPKTDGLER